MKLNIEKTFHMRAKSTGKNAGNKTNLESIRASTTIG